MDGTPLRPETHPRQVLGGRLTLGRVRPTQPLLPPAGTTASEAILEIVEIVENRPDVLVLVGVQLRLNCRDDRIDDDESCRAVADESVKFVHVSGEADRVERARIVEHELVYASNGEFPVVSGGEAWRKLPLHLAPKDRSPSGGGGQGFCYSTAGEICVLPPNRPDGAKAESSDMGSAAL